jgi:hypothetical protein
MRHEIVDFASITPARLTAILADRGLLGQETIESIRIAHIHESPTAFVAFLHASYTGHTLPGVPCRFAVKMYKPDVRSTWGAKEIAFYTILVPSVASLPIVPCYDAFIDPQGTVCYCLFADMSDLVGSPLTPAPLITDQLSIASTALAQLHAAFWNHRYIRGALLDETSQIFVEDFSAHPQRAVELFARFHDRIPSRWKTIISTFISTAEQSLLARLRTSPALTLWHSDAHLGNFLFTPEPSHAVYIIDFATCRAWWGARDIAYMLTISLDPVLRRAHEMSILQHYHKQLCSNGISTYTWEQCWEDYRWAALANIRTPLGNRNRPYAWERLERAITAYEDLNCDQLLIAS